MVSRSVVKSILDKYMNLKELFYMQYKYHTIAICSTWNIENTITSTAKVCTVYSGTPKDTSVNKHLLSQVSYSLYKIQVF